MSATPLLGLLDWLGEPSQRRGVHVFDGADWRFCSYRTLADRVRRCAGGLRRAGVGPGDDIALVLRSGVDFATVFFAGLLAGGAVTPVAPPRLFRAAADYRRYLQALLAEAGPRVVVTEPDLVAEVASVSPAGSVRTVEQLMQEGPVPAPARQETAALIQFTSGSSARPRGVVIPDRALRANVHAIRSWLRWTPEDPVASWLPLHHDMGLIGCFVAPVVSGSDLWLLTPEQFIHRPLEYLRCFGERGARLTAMPAFGLDHLLRRVRPEQLAGLDLSQWRAMIVGSEQLRAESFERAYELLAPAGFDRRAILPAYGLAEATLAVTGSPLDEEWRSCSIDAAAVLPGQPVPRGEPAPSGQPVSSGGSRRVAVVGCGYPLTGATVRILDDAGRPLPAGSVGEIEVCGASVGDGYTRVDASAGTRFTAGALRTGDAGFVLDGQLYVLGRLGDSLKVRGRAVFAEDVEAELQRRMPGHPVVAVALGMHAGEPTAVVLVERRAGTPGMPAPAARTPEPDARTPEPDARTPAPVTHQADAGLPEWVATVGLLTGGARAVVRWVPRSAVPRTTSGKVRRRAIWSAFVDGETATEQTANDQTATEQTATEQTRTHTADGPAPTTAEPPTLTAARVPASAASDARSR